MEKITVPSDLDSLFSLIINDPVYCYRRKTDKSTCHPSNFDEAEEYLDELVENANDKGIYTFKRAHGYYSNAEFKPILYCLQDLGMRSFSIDDLDFLIKDINREADIKEDDGWVY